MLDIGVTVGVTMQDDRVAARKEKVQEYVFDMDLARESIGMPVHFRHGTKMAAVAQCRRNESAKNFIYIYLGAKISGAIIYDGKVVDFSGINGELGCMLTLNPSDSVRVDSIFSRKILCKKAGCKNLPEFFTKVKEKDPVCTPIWHTYLEQLTLFAHDIFCLFGWPIVLGGSVSLILATIWLFLKKKSTSIMLSRRSPTRFSPCLPWASMAPPSARLSYPSTAFLIQISKQQKLPYPYWLWEFPLLS